MQIAGRDEISPRGPNNEGLDGLEAIFLVGAAVWIAALLLYL